MKIETVIRFIKGRIRYHRKEFDRYKKEVNEIANMRYISKKNKSQLNYSYNHMYRELSVIDELELIILEKVEKYSSKTNKTKKFKTKVIRRKNSGSIIRRESRTSHLSEKSSEGLK